MLTLEDKSEVEDICSALSQARALVQCVGDSAASDRQISEALEGISMIMQRLADRLDALANLKA